MIAMRKPSLVLGLALLVLAAPLAGCLGGKSNPTPTTSPSSSTPTASTPTGSTPTPTSPTNPTPHPKPADVNVTDKGDVSGQYTKKWAFKVEATTFTTFHVEYDFLPYSNNPAGLCAAHTILQLKDSNNTVVKTATVSGPCAGPVKWDLTGGDVKNLGDWSLQAVDDGSVPVPNSGGLYSYKLQISITY